ncbi:MAG: hypothetical protein ACE5I2_02410 [Anaerolineae bacterium]
MKPFRTRQEQEAAWRLIHKWRFHDPETGFLAWKPNTPEVAKVTYEKLMEQIEEEFEELEEL